jgi:hypothetical protein
LHDGKRYVRVYDYADLNVPMLARMFDRRCRGYEAIGYWILLPASVRLRSLRTPGELRRDLAEALAEAGDSRMAGGRRPTVRPGVEARLVRQRAAARPRWRGRAACEIDAHGARCAA